MIYVMRIKKKLVLNENKLLTNEKRNKIKDLYFVEMYICAWKFLFGKATHFFGIYPNINQYIYIYIYIFFNIFCLLDKIQCTISRLG